MLKIIYGGQAQAQSLSAAISKIYTNPTSIEEKKESIIEYNNVTGKKLPFNNDVNVNQSWSTIESLKESVYKYYEYVQLKRAKFDCKTDDTGVVYDTATGRIVSMTFVFNGKFE